MQNNIRKINYPQCTYNEGVCCHPALEKCARCGWNPEVEKVRNAKIKNSMKG